MARMEGTGQDLPIGWEERASGKYGKSYYLNMFTKESQWRKPGVAAGMKGETGNPRNESSIICRHILVKHVNSIRPFSWRDDDIQRSEAEAKELLKEIRSRISSGSLTFRHAATRFSDCSSGKYGGFLGRFRRGVMKKEFEDAAFGLNVKEMSDIVQTDSGFHIILRTM